MLVAQSCDPMGCSLPGSSVHGIFQARILEWFAIPFSRESSWPRDWTQVSCTAGRFFTNCTTKEVPICLWRFSFFWGGLCCPACRIIVPQPGMESVPPSSARPLQWNWTAHCAHLLPPPTRLPGNPWWFLFSWKQNSKQGLAQWPSG